MKSVQECSTRYTLLLEAKIKSLKVEIKSLLKKISTHKAYLKAVVEVNHQLKSGRKVKRAKKYKPQFEDKCGTYPQLAQQKLHQLKRKFAMLSALCHRVKSAELHL